MRSALLTKLNSPLEILDLSPSRLDYGQVRVKVLCSGICGAQLQEITGQKKGGPLPHPLGHEGAGIVEEIGPGVKHVAVGNKVVMHWRQGAGIESDYPAYQVVTPDAQTPVMITGGRVTTFGEMAVCSENRLTTVPGNTPDELCALLGCGLSTALATLENEANLKRGQSILIVGCGGLGTNLILASCTTHAYPIVVTDIVDKAHLCEMLGADQFIKFHAPAFMDGRMKQRFDVIVETSGNPIAIQATLPLLAPSGRYIMIGQPKPGAEVVISNAFHFFEGSGKTLMATQGGGYKPHLDIPRYLAAYRAGNLPIRGMVSHRLPLDQINDGLHLVRAGEASRVMIVMN